ncbi:hypothetical protein NPIL_104511 [Nephila pilipes]|uniref:Uncharacterized protein n=1 Tax=Nephila pilipes TaxID=299642 RepID=A0A8X6TCE3_NEPPI|nr:hypothetical protein NPIL_104511 [Nephila pilipes]
MAVLLVNMHKKQDLNRYNVDSVISIYLSHFVRKIRGTDVPKQEWTLIYSHRVPLEVVNVVVRIPDLGANDFNHMSKLLLKSFKLNLQHS